VVATILLLAWSPVQAQLRVRSRCVVDQLVFVHCKQAISLTVATANSRHTRTAVAGLPAAHLAAFHLISVQKETVITSHVEGEYNRDCSHQLSSKLGSIISCYPSFVRKDFCALKLQLKALRLKQSDPMKQTGEATCSCCKSDSNRR
jgi:hypothetical protein